MIEHDCTQTYQKERVWVRLAFDFRRKSHVVSYSDRLVLSRRLIMQFKWPIVLSEAETRWSKMISY